MPDYRLFQKDQSVRAVNLLRQDQQDVLATEGYGIVRDVIYADNADAAVVRHKQLRHDEDNAAQTFATDSVLSTLFSLISR
ncbi:hypothetical protein [Pantoea sp. GD03673]|uniref:hypothetical protein n=1 Tax=Pantoea sp. GD03673 TaxID=2975364 RepID=UPI00244786EC|nr:hypothetical protein [Pantoea sp. GD03673]MDH2066810.1 hypothetical protein [Pantoea sp. GD03673]